MRIQLLHSYKGIPSAYIRIPAGEHDLAPDLASYLVENGHAIVLDPAPVIEEAPESDTESLSDLRNRYKELAGKGASPKWDADTLREKIEALEDAESDNPGL